MDITSVVLYKGVLAYYTVSVHQPDAFSAHLISYKGKEKPPEVLYIRKEGRHWVGDVNCQDLVDDLGYDIDNKLQLQSLTLPRQK